MLIKAQIERSFLEQRGPGKLPVPRRDRIGEVMGVICPHAGYIYSGASAAHSYYSLALDGRPDTIVILGPNHHGLSSRVAISEEERWITPLGIIHVDSEIAEVIASRSKYAKIDETAHVKEHSIEVQLPFIQYLFGSHTKIVPIIISHLGLRDATDVMNDLSTAISNSIKGKNAIVLASTDFTHYESQQVTYAKDKLALAQIVLLDAEGLLETVYENDITMCGAVGTAIAIEVCKHLGANHAQQLTYYTSGDVTGEEKHVVGYASVVFKAIPSNA